MLQSPLRFKFPGMTLALRVWLMAAVVANRASSCRLKWTLHQRTFPVPVAWRSSPNWVGVAVVSKAPLDVTLMVVSARLCLV